MWANNIKAFRKKIGMSQKTLAEALKITQGAVSQWEAGVTAPQIEKLAELARVLDCTVDDLLKESA